MIEDNQAITETREDIAELVKHKDTIRKQTVRIQIDINAMYKRLDKLTDEYWNAKFDAKEVVVENVADFVKHKALKFNGDPKNTPWYVQWKGLDFNGTSKDDLISQIYNHEFA